MHDTGVPKRAVMNQRGVAAAVDEAYKDGCDVQYDAGVADGRKGMVSTQAVKAAVNNLVSECSFASNIIFRYEALAAIDALADEGSRR